MAASRTPWVVALAAITAACAVFAVVAGITSDDDDDSVAAAPTAPVTTVAGAAVSEVTIQEFAFAPQELQLAVGDTVTWTNLDGFAHSVRASDQTFGSENLDQGGTFQFTFSAAGSYAYICGIHPSMTGTVVVS